MPWKKNIKDNKLWTCKIRIHGVNIHYIHILLDELSDYDNMNDENELEPDYYIDRPVIIYLN